MVVIHLTDCPRLEPLPLLMGEGQGVGILVGSREGVLSPVAGEFTVQSPSEACKRPPFMHFHALS